MTCHAKYDLFFLSNQHLIKDGKKEKKAMISALAQQHRI